MKGKEKRVNLKHQITLDLVFIYFTKQETQVVPLHQIENIL